MNNKKITTLFLLSFFAVLLISCSDDKGKSTAAAQNQPQMHTNKPSKNHVDYGEASESVKQKFESVFSKKCVERELKNSINKDIDQKRFEDSCTCIAHHIAEDLSDVDAEKYLLEHEDTQALEIKFDTAAFFCLQNKPLPKGPHLFGKQQ
jgi:hypothetical protein